MHLIEELLVIMASQSTSSLFKRFTPEGTTYTPVSTHQSDSEDDIEHQSLERRDHNGEQFELQPLNGRDHYGEDIELQPLNRTKRTEENPWKRKYVYKSGSRSLRHILVQYPRDAGDVSNRRPPGDENMEEEHVSDMRPSEHVYSFYVTRTQVHQLPRTFKVEHHTEANPIGIISNPNSNAPRNRLRALGGQPAIATTPMTVATQPRTFLSPAEMNEKLGIKMGWTRWPDGLFRPPPSLKKFEPTISAHNIWPPLRQTSFTS
jgi:hypothetical protein